MLPEQLRHREDGANPHFVGIAAGNGNSAIDAERLQASPFGGAGIHQHAGGSAVRKLRGVARSDRPAFRHRHSVPEHRLQAVQAFERRIGTVALVALKRNLHAPYLAGGFVLDLHEARERHDLCVEAAGGLRLRGALLRGKRVFVLPVARYMIAFGNDLRRLQHRHVKGRTTLHEPWVAMPVEVHLRGLHQRDGFQPAADGDRHAVLDDLLGGDGNRHQPGGALAVDRHAGHRGRQPGAQG